jgi:hypothetical protein
MLTTAEIPTTRLGQLRDLPLYVGILALIALKLHTGLSHQGTEFILRLKLRDNKRVCIRPDSFALATYPSWYIEFYDEKERYQLRMEPSPTLFIEQSRTYGGTYWEKCELLI